MSNDSEIVEVRRSRRPVQPENAGLATTDNRWRPLRTSMASLSRVGCEGLRRRRRGRGRRPAGAEAAADSEAGAPARVA
jgi:hypothetical protein